MSEPSSEELHVNPAYLNATHEIIGWMTFAPRSPEEIAASVCPQCKTNTQIWQNQITKKYTCHRAGCHIEITLP